LAIDTGAWGSPLADTSLVKYAEADQATREVDERETVGMLREWGGNDETI